MSKDPKGVALILGRLEKKPDDAEGDEYEMAASEVLDAVESKDSKALAEAMKSFVQMCQSAED